MITHNIYCESPYVDIQSRRQPQIDEKMLGNSPQIQEGNCSSVVKDASACISYAIAATVFYKKTFKSELFPSVVIFAYVGAFLDYAYYKVEPRVMVALLLTGIFCCANLLRNGLVPLKRDVLVFFFILMDARWNIVNQLCPVHVTYWMRIFFFAVPQFIRKPIWLKNKLQDIRAMFGPLYIFCIAAYMPESSEFLRVMKHTALLFSFVAGVISRPDNSVIMTSLGLHTTFSRRRRFHRDFMITSFVCVVIVVMVDGYLSIVSLLVQNVISGSDKCVTLNNTFIDNLFCSDGNVGDNHTVTLGIVEMM